MKQEEIIKWYKVEYREATEEEKEYYQEIYGTDLCYVFDCKMPEDGEEILIVTKWGVESDVCGEDDGFYLEGRGDWDDVIAWAEMPKGVDWSEE